MTRRASDANLQIDSRGRAKVSFMAISVECDNAETMGQLIGAAISQFRGVETAHVPQQIEAAPEAPRAIEAPPVVVQELSPDAPVVRPIKLPPHPSAKPKPMHWAMKRRLEREAAAKAAIAPAVTPKVDPPKTAAPAPLRQASVPRKPEHAEPAMPIDRSMSLPVAILKTVPESGTITWADMLRAVTALMRPAIVTADQIEDACQQLVIDGVLVEPKMSTYGRAEAKA